MSGVTETGFEAETTDTLKTAIEAELKIAFGNAFNVRPTSVAGVWVGIFARKLADLWDAAEAIYNSQYPETAFGTSLDQLGLLTGAQRLPATRSESVLGLTGTPGTIIPTGSRVRNSDTGSFWRLQEDNGDITIPGTSATTGTWESEETGEVLGIAGSLDTIDTVISGWDTVNNTEDADLGRDIETDAAFRLRRAELLVAQGKGTLDAIRADVLAVEGITEVAVYENYTGSTDANGLPSKSFEVVVRQGTAVSASIWQAIWDSKPAGISAYGTTVGTATDDVEASHAIAYTRATEIPIYIAVTATTGAGFGATATGVASIKASLTAYGTGRVCGDDVIKQALQALPFDVSGVVDVPTMKLDIYAAPTATANIAIGIREVATFDTSRITVTLL